MKIAVIGDTHLGCTVYTDKRASDFSAKFNLAVGKALEQKACAVLILGDVFDSSAYRRSVDSFASALGEVATSFVKLKGCGVEVFAIAGNHEYGRGRSGGELRILSDLGVIQFLDDEVKEFHSLRIAGISWKSDPALFRDALKKLGRPTKESILMIHQFCEGSRLLPPFLSEVKERDLKGWPVVFTGHHHQYENLGYAIAPGSLEVHNANEMGPKGFVWYDTEAKAHEFITLPASRPIRYVEMEGDGKSAPDFEKAVEKWIRSNASIGALLVIKVEGALSSGRSIDINWNHLRSIGYQAGCLKVHFEGGLRDQVRTAPEIRATVNFQDFLRKRFGSRSSKATKYVDALREEGGAFSTEILDAILKETSQGER